MNRHAKASSAGSTEGQASCRSRKLLLGFAAAFALTLVFGVTLASAVTPVVPSAPSGAACLNEARRAEQHASFLPDCRAFEMVSPPGNGKRGADINGDSQRTRAAADGGAVTFASLGGFGDVRGSGVATEYMAERSSDSAPGSNGWSTHGITPSQESGTLFGAIRGLEPVWEGEMSADLSKGVLRAWSPLTDEDPNILNAVNDYRRDDLRTPGPGNYQLLSSCPACGSPLGPFSITQSPAFVSASADFSHVLFSSEIALIAGASGGSPNLYEWVNGTLSLAGVLPDSACGVSPCLAAGSIVGGYRPISTDGSRVIFKDAGTGQVYERIDGTQTIQISASEKTNGGGPGGADPSGPQPATIETASADGTRVFFITSEELTNDDENIVSDLYMWDATAPAGSRLTLLSVDSNLTDPPGNARGVLGASDDGRYVYFATSGQLVAGKPTFVSAFYAWHDGSIPTVSYIGEMAHVGDDNVDFLGGAQLGGGVRSRVSPDGTHLLFTSSSGAGLLSAHGGVDYDQTHCGNGCDELYLYTATSDSLACVSCNPSGAPATTSASDVAKSGTGGSTNTSHRNHPLTDDGRNVFFHTAEKLVPEDTNGAIDVYEYDSGTGTPHLISSGTDPANSLFLDASSDGKNAFFLTRQKLVGWDVDTNNDLYDARSGGGFPEPPPTQAICTGETCKIPASAPPGSAQLPASNSFNGPADPRTKHKKKPKRRRHHQGRRRAGHNHGGAK